MFHYVKLTSPLSFKTIFPERGLPCRRQVVGLQHQTSQRQLQSLGTSLQNILVENINFTQEFHSSIQCFNIRSRGRSIPWRYVMSKPEMHSLCMPSLLLVISVKKIVKFTIKAAHTRKPVLKTTVISCLFLDGHLVFVEICYNKSVLNKMDRGRY